MAKREILLVEPADDHKYPPLGLMKIASYHRQLGDEVTFVRGCSPKAANHFWDRIYITTLFSFDWARLIETVNYYKNNLFGSSRILVGGIAASLLPDLLYAQTGIYPFRGCLNQPGLLDPDNDVVVDRLVPDYSILKQVDYEYASADAYIGYTTRGCIRKCSFCAVPDLEPEFIDYIDIKSYIRGIAEQHGEKPHLLRWSVLFRDPVILN